MKISEKARQVLKLPDEQIKAICFISGWEKSKLDSVPPESDEKEYLLNEFNLFSYMRSRLLDEGELSLIAYREFDDNYEFNQRKRLKRLKKSSPEIDKLHNFNKNFLKHTLKTKSKIRHFNLIWELENLVNNHIHLLPNNEEMRDYLKYFKYKIVDSYKVDILCIDYQYYFNGTILHKYIEFIEDYVYPKNKLPLDNNLFQLFKNTSIDVSVFSYHFIKEIIQKAYENNISIDDLDKIEFLSTNHIQRINEPFFWKKIKKDGYLCNYNDYELEIKKINKKSDFRFFYSFESLLFFELRQCLIKTKRCLNCNYPLPNKVENKLFKGKYCYSQLLNYKNCIKERSRKRQKKHYNLTKI